MILKKPYAFLIKYFKLIHIVILGLLSYINSYYKNIYAFYKDYSSSNYYDLNIAKEYLPTLSFIVVVVLISLFIILFYLMKKKDKPNTLYILSITYYALVLISMLVAYENINTLYDVTLTQRTSRLYNNIYFILNLPSYYFIFTYLVRGIGFDIKKFNFSKDLEELDIKAEDNEEFEFVIGTKDYLIKRKIHRFFREVKYYYKENEFLINIIGGTFIGVVSIVLLINISSTIHKYHLGNKVNAEKFKIILNNAYVTNKDYTGKVINQNKKYLILDITINNLGTNELKPSEMYIKYGNNKQSIMKLSMQSSFSDLGKIYNGDLIKKEPENLIFIYELPQSASTNNLKLAIYKGKTITSKEIKYNFVEYKFNAKKIDKSPKNNLVELNQNLNLGNKLYGNTTIDIKNVETKNKYTYTYDKCYSEENCEKLTNIITPNGGFNYNLMIVDYDISIDKNSLLGRTYNDDIYIINKFSKLKYKVNNEEKEINIFGTKYDNLPNKIIYEIPASALKSEELFFIFETRENKYLYKIK